MANIELEMESRLIADPNPFPEDLYPRPNEMVTVVLARDASIFSLCFSALLAEAGAVVKTDLPVSVLREMSENDFTPATLNSFDGEYLYRLYELEDSLKDLKPSQMTLSDVILVLSQHPNPDNAVCVGESQRYVCRDQHTEEHETPGDVVVLGYSSEPVTVAQLLKQLMIPTGHDSYGIPHVATTPVWVGNPKEGVYLTGSCWELGGPLSFVDNSSVDQ